MKCSAKAPAMHPTALQRNTSDGNFAVCFSMAFATLPSENSGRDIVDIFLFTSMLNITAFERPALEGASKMPEDPWNHGYSVLNRRQSDETGRIRFREKLGSVVCDY